MQQTETFAELSCSANSWCLKSGKGLHYRPIYRRAFPALNQARKYMTHACRNHCHKLTNM